MANAAAAETGNVSKMQLVLVEPEIPQNTGNIARTCVMTGTALHLVEPLGFSITEKAVRRAGLDYWPHLQLSMHRDFNALVETRPGARFFFYSTRGRRLYTEPSYRGDDFLVFGSETRGLPDHLLRDAAQVLRIPMIGRMPRSLNLANAAAVVLFEALRQQGFPDLC
jgi:tRNA (cytidine/uridine-2'-O-)-methyltransferase